MTTVAYPTATTHLLPDSDIEPGLVMAVSLDDSRQRLLHLVTGAAHQPHLRACAARLSVENARALQSVILMENGGHFLVGVRPPFAFGRLRQLALALGIGTSALEHYELSSDEFASLFDLAYYTQPTVNVTAPPGSKSWYDLNPAAKPHPRQSPVSPSLPATASEGDTDGQYKSYFRQIMETAARRGASDVHCKPAVTENGIFRGKIYFRVDGDIETYIDDIPQDEFERLTRAISDLTGTVAYYDLPYSNQDAAIKTQLPQRDSNTFIPVKLRVAAAPSLHGADISLRILTNTFRDFPAMGYEPEQLEALFEAVTHKHGLILVTGETGSGKSTLLEAMLRRVEAQRRYNVIVISDPIEYQCEGRTEIEIKPGYTFADALKTALRKDPNVIVVGEMRDEEVAEIAFRAAYTGHLVLSTLHTNNVAATFARLSNLGIKPYDQAGLLLSLTAQRLVPRLCLECRAPDPRTEYYRDLLATRLFPERPGLVATLAQAETFYMARPEGCPACREGFKGRLAVAEVLTLNSELNEMVSREQPGAEIVARACESYGMLDFAAVAARKLASGVTSYGPLSHWLRPPAARSTSHRTRNGFSLLELLVVIAIIAVLTVIAVPVYTGHRRAAIEGTVTTKLRLIGTTQQTFRAALRKNRYATLEELQTTTIEGAPLLTARDTSAPQWTFSEVAGSVTASSFGVQAVPAANVADYAFVLFEDGEVRRCAQPGAIDRNCPLLNVP